MSVENEVVETFHDRVLDRVKFTLLQGECSTFRPLRLTPFEWFMFADGVQGFPMTFMIRLVFSGQVDREAFVTSVCQAVQRHPLLRAHVTGSNRRTLAWVPADNPIPYLDFGDLTKPICIPDGEAIDLRSETGLRVWVRSGEDRTEMHFQFHHACCDGIGAYRVLEDILCSYDLTVNGSSSEAVLRPLEPERLATRSRLNVERSGNTSRGKRVPFRPFRTAIGFFFKLPEGIYSGTRVPFAGGRNETVPNFATHTFTSSETRKLRSAASRFGGSTNDLLTRDLFVAIQEWNECHQQNDRTGMIRLMLPVTQRTPEEEELFPACNRVSMVRINRSRDSLANPDELLSGIVREMRQILPLRRDLTFHQVAAVVRAVPLLLWFVRRRDNRGYATTVLSHTGKVFSHARLPRHHGIIHSGGMALEAVDGAPPVNPFTPVSFAAIWYARRLTITMSFDRTRFTKEQADDLLSTYVRRILSSANDVPTVDVKPIATAAERIVSTRVEPEALN